MFHNRLVQRFSCPIVYYTLRVLLFTHDTQIIKDKGEIQWVPNLYFDFQIMFTIFQLERVEQCYFHFNELFNEMINVMIF